VGVKLGLSNKGSKWEKNKILMKMFGPKRENESSAEESCIMNVFMICTPWHVLLK
jgi:hypothetical protein